jgi:hypothetical protein
MFGLIWMVQIVHYPMFSLVGVNEFPKYASCHQRNISLVVMPLMTVEAVTGAFLVVLYPERITFCIAMLALVLIWGSTFLIQVPLHRKLAKGFDARNHELLVRTNWIRTILWSFRSFLLLLP